MINVNTKILKDLNHNEFWVLVHLAKKININNTCYPSLSTLQKETSFSKNKIISILKSLTDKSFVSVEKRVKDDGSQTSNLYTIQTDFLGVYVSAKGQSIDVSDSKLGGSKTEQGVVQKLNRGGSKIEPKVLSNEVLYNLLHKLNNLSGKKLRLVENNLKEIKARLRDKKNKYTIEDLEIIIEHKCTEWKDEVFSNGKPAKNYLKPQTLFNSKNIEKYLTEAIEWREGGRQKSGEKKDDYLLTPELEKMYESYLKWVKTNFDLLWRKKKYFSKQQYEDLQMNKTIKTRDLYFTKQSWKQTINYYHKLTKKEPWIMTNEGDFYNFFIKQLRLIINNEIKNPIYTTKLKVA